MDKIKGKIPGPETGIEIKKSICCICDPLTQCGLDVYLQGGRIIKVEGTRENPHNAGTLCAKGAATRQYVYHKDRLRTPLKRNGPRGEGKFIPVSWDEALDYIAGQLIEIKKNYGPEAVVFYAGYSKWMRPFLQRLAHAFGSPNYASESSTCARATTMAWKLTFGSQAVADIPNSRCLLVWSTNPFYSNSCLSRGILDAREKGLKIICVDPRYTPMAALADIHLPLKPGTDGALALAMANVIINEELYDRDFINNYTYGFEAYRDYVRQFTPERGAAITGVPAGKIIEAARLYATTKPGSLMTSACAVVHHTNGVQNYRAVMSLVGLTGNYDIKGGNVVNPPSYIGVPAGFTTRESEYALPRKWEEMPPRIGAEQFPVWCELVNEAQAMMLPFQINSGQPYPLKAMLSFGLNHRMWPASSFMAESLKRLDLLVDVDLFMTDSARLADVVLPACSSLERSELRCYPENYVIYTRPAIEPLYASRPDTDIIFELARRLKIEDPLLNAGYEASLDWILAPGGLTIAELKKHPAGMFVPCSREVQEKKYRQKGFATPTGKMEFQSRLLETYGYEGLPVYRPPRSSVDETPEQAQEYPFILNTGSRLPMFIHSRTFRLSWTRSLRPEPALDMNPVDANRLSIQQGDRVRLSTPRGSIQVLANLTQTVMPGVIHMYHGYTEADVNLLIAADYLDPISGYPGYKALLCKVEKLED
ncbi:Acetylene hydratase [Neomoorella glycerini]|uniref:Acetylene hydratase n=1 Tax=Neomoorella glycerini TaxID=55779 RepID=A0A6I5ZNL4_9FIRM|nr:molybdopterin-dependent oxidoreductase [Moorella glycerini]QGP91502.1 Acetylene hydratase [Moorella glycerini]